jgi:hypothetical protein
VNRKLRYRQRIHCFKILVNVLDNNIDRFLVKGDMVAVTALNTANFLHFIGADRCY